MRRRGVLAAGAALVGWRAHAASTMRIVVAYPPGGVSDRFARLFAERFAAVLGRGVIVDNQPGAGGSLALGALVRAPVDGSVLVFTAISPLAIGPHLGMPAPRVTPVAAVMHTPLLLLGTPALAAAGFQGMVREAQARSGGVRWATSGVATIGHLALEQVRREFALEVVHVPYTGGGPQLQDALAGRFELLSSNLAPLQIEYVRTGRLKALAVGAPARSELLPSVPTFVEAGCPAANLSSIFGLFAPQGASASDVARLNAACNEVLAQPDFRRALAEGGNLAASGSAADFSREIARQSEVNARLVAGMRR